MPGPTTFEQYSQVARDHIVPLLGSIKLIDLRPDQVQKLYTKKLQAGISTRSVRLIHAVLHRSLQHELKLSSISRNPASATTPPKSEQKEMKFLTEAEITQFLIAAADSRLRTLYQLAITTGMRQGEILGLQWADLDWGRRTLQIKRQLKHKKGGGFRFPPPKTKAGRRVVELG